MTETTASPFDLDWPSATRRPRSPSPLAIGIVAGAILGSVLTAFAAEPVRSLLATPEVGIVAAQEFRHRPIEAEWRGYRTPVDVDVMFMKRR